MATVHAPSAPRRWLAAAVAVLGALTVGATVATAEDAPARAGEAAAPFALAPAGDPGPDAPARAGDDIAGDGIAGPGRNALPEAFPFDINADGRAPADLSPPAGRAAPLPTTTVSPLGRVRGSPEETPVDALSAEQRQELNRLLKEGTDTLRELRVNVGGEDGWLESVVDRPVVPFRALRLEGEIDARSWMVFLSGTEANRGATLSVAFTNSVLVLPEASRLRVFVNQRLVMETAIDSPGRTKVVAIPLISEILRAGPNAIRMEVDQRHRIDCSLAATWELWTRIDTRLTGLTFPGGRIILSGLADLPAVGVGVNGATTVRVHESGVVGRLRRDETMRAVQVAALQGRFGHPLVEVVDLASRPPVERGTVNLLIGPFAEVRQVVPTVPAEGELAPLVTLVDTSDLGPTVILTGPNDRAVSAAIDRFAAGIQPLAPDLRIAAVPPWLAPLGVRVDGASSFSLREAGVPTQEFSGRRFTTSFEVALPPDFYAAAYGEAKVLLNAAYASDVLPGSRINVLVNGALATSFSFTSPDGEVFERYPISLGMRGFRPGINRITISAELLTEADAVCLPGGTVPTRPRFVLFNSTRMVFPDFARIGQLPNLAAFATSGFPYGRDGEPLALRLGGSSPDTVGAAATLLARLASNRGQPLAVETVDTDALILDRPALVVAPLSETGTAVLDVTGASFAVPGTWLSAFPDSPQAGPEGLDRYDDVLRRLRQQQRLDDLEANQADGVETGALVDRSTDQLGETERLRRAWLEDVTEGGTIRQALSEATEWLGERFAFDFSVRDELVDLEQTPLLAETTLILAQAAAPQEPRTAWTLVTAPTPGMLSASVAAATAEDTWSRMDGRLAAFSLETGVVTTIPAREVTYIATAPLSFGNLRLVAANWFSLNDGIYAVATVLAGLLLAIATAAFVRRSGRTGRTGRTGR